LGAILIKKKEKPKLSLLYVVVIVLIILVSISVVIISISFNKTPRNGEGVPLYLGSRIFGKIVVDELEVSLSQFQDTALPNPCILMFGLTTCPHCHNMYEFFQKHYPDNYRAFWIDTDRTAAELFMMLVDIETKNGVPQHYAMAVPQTVIVVNSKVKAVVIGEVQEAEFWENLLKNN